VTNSFFLSGVEGNIDPVNRNCPLHFLSFLLWSAFRGLAADFYGRSEATMKCRRIRTQIIEKPLPTLIHLRVSTGSNGTGQGALQLDGPLPKIRIMALFMPQGIGSGTAGQRAADIDCRLKLHSQHAVVLRPVSKMMKTAGIPVTSVAPPA
jgi:hypothetical protein